MSSRRHRKRRLRDFETRGEPTKLLSPSGEDLGLYIEVHPFSDDVDALAELSWSADRCRAVDLYWKVNQDVVFVQFWTRTGPWDRSPGYYARLRGAGPTELIVGVVTANTLVGRVEAEVALRALAGAGLSELSQAELSTKFGVGLELTPLPLPH